MNNFGFVEQFGKYRVESEIGQGGFGTVYRATDTLLDRPIALKKLDPMLMRDTVWVSRFRREAKMMARLEHPHIVPIYEIDEIDGQLFIAMKLIEGLNLAEHLKQHGRLPWHQIGSLMQQLGSALDYAYSLSVVHRDLKPSNVLLSGQHAFITDFGFARVVGDNSHSITVSGSVVGTPSYIAPEIWEGKASGNAADCYALGCILYEVITGDVLFQGDSAPSIMLQHFRPPPLPSQLPSDVPVRVIQVIERSLARNPAERFVDAKSMVQALGVTHQSEPASDVTAHLKEAAKLALDKFDLEGARSFINSLKEVSPNHPEIASLIQRYKSGVESMRSQPTNNQKSERTRVMQQPSHEPTKSCHFCAEKIKVEAKVCRYCYKEQPGNNYVDKQPHKRALANTSGQGKDAVVPPEIKKWNWGAFLLAFFWSIGNKTYIGLLTLVPYLGFIMLFVLGAKGSEWAWRNKEWESIEHFNKTQRAWTKWGVGVFIVVFIISFLVGIS